MEVIKSELSTLNRHKKSLAFSTLICIIAMFLFKNSTASIIVASIITAPYLISMLNNDDQDVALFDRKRISLNTIFYSLSCLFIFLTSILLLYIPSLILDFGNVFKICMVFIYSTLYCLAAPYLYKIATGICGKKYGINFYAATIAIVGVTELVIYALKQLVVLYSIMSLVAAPLVCLSYVISIYLITIVNMRNNDRTKSK